MEDKKKKIIFILIIFVATIILIGVGSTFAYFSATISSDEDAIHTTSAEFKIDFSDDISLIKGKIIPSAEKYVDIAAKRVDENGNFLKPYEVDGEEITEGTVCIDDNLYEICSLYSFTIKNSMTETDLPIYVTIDTTYNTFENLYYKVLDKDLNEVIPATRLQDDRYVINADGTFAKDKETGELIKKDNFDELKISPVVLEEINTTLAKATDENTPTAVTYHIVMWVMEIDDDQTTGDSGKTYAGTLQVTNGPDGKGITAVFATGGTE